MSASWCSGWGTCRWTWTVQLKRRKCRRGGKRERPMDRGIERDRTTKHKQKRQRNTDTNLHHGSDDDDLCNRTQKNAKTQIELEMSRNRKLQSKERRAEKFDSGGDDIDVAKCRHWWRQIAQDIFDPPTVTFFMRIPLNCLHVSKFIVK